MLNHELASDFPSTIQALSLSYLIHNLSFARAKHQAGLRATGDTQRYLDTSLEKRLEHRPIKGPINQWIIVGIY